jgi:hypothetical protein
VLAIERAKVVLQNGYGKTSLGLRTFGSSLKSGVKDRFLPSYPALCTTACVLLWKHSVAKRRKKLIASLKVVLREAACGSDDMTGWKWRRREEKRRRGEDHIW